MQFVTTDPSAGKRLPAIRIRVPTFRSTYFRWYTLYLFFHKETFSSIFKNIHCTFQRENTLSVSSVKRRPLIGLNGKATIHTVVVTDYLKENSSYPRYSARVGNRWRVYTTWVPSWPENALYQIASSCNQ